jgi:hypothetical protein
MRTPAAQALPSATCSCAAYFSSTGVCVSISAHVTGSVAVASSSSLCPLRRYPTWDGVHMDRDAAWEGGDREGTRRAARVTPQRGAQAHRMRPLALAQAELGCSSATGPSGGPRQVCPA